MKNIPTKKLINGIDIPLIGNGPALWVYFVDNKPTWTNANKLFRFSKRIYTKFEHKFITTPQLVEKVAFAMKNGCFLLDYAESYSAENLIGEAIKKSGIERKKLFLTARVGNVTQKEGKTRESLLRTLDLYNTDYVDLFMFHWPVPNFYTNTWKEMEILYKEGFCKAIGVANCNVHHLEAIFNICKIQPMLNQFEIHPLFTQKPLIEYCKQRDIAVEGYTPLARFDERLKNAFCLQELSKKYNKTIPQVILRWHIQNDIIPIVRSMNQKRQIENISIFDFELTADEVNRIDKLNINSRLRYDPDNLNYSVVC